MFTFLFPFKILFKGLQAGYPGGNTMSSALPTLMDDMLTSPPLRNFASGPWNRVCLFPGQGSQLARLAKSSGFLLTAATVADVMLFSAFAVT